MILWNICFSGTDLKLFFLSSNAREKGYDQIFRDCAMLEFCIDQIEQRLHKAKSIDIREHITHKLIIAMKHLTQTTST